MTRTEEISSCKSNVDADSASSDFFGSSTYQSIFTCFCKTVQGFCEASRLGIIDFQMWNISKLRAEVSNCENELTIEEFYSVHMFLKNMCFFFMT